MAIRFDEVQIDCAQSTVLIGLVVENAVLDICTDTTRMHAAIAMLEREVDHTEHMELGEFGPLAITLNSNRGDSASVFIDGPNFGPGRNMSAAIWCDKQELLSVLRRGLAAAEQHATPDVAASAASPLRQPRR
jgi:hypothetical protein